MRVMGTADPPGNLPILALRPLRHACHSCGTCCHGWQVELEDAEVIAAEEQGRVLGVAAPVVDGVLRRQDGRCVFLDDALRCRVHATFGAAAKPRVCQLYPLRAVLAEDGLRVGVDPSCTSTLETWRDGPLVEPLRTVEQVRELDPALLDDERALLALASAPDITVAGFAAGLAGDPTAPPELPAGLAARLLERLQVPAVAEQLMHPRRGALMLGQLAHVPPTVTELSDRNMPVWSNRLAPEIDEFAIEVLRRHIFMRLGDPTVPPVAQALLMLAGILACGWSGSDAARFGPALAAWSRAIRGRALWGPLIPDSATAHWILSGVR